MHYIMQLWVCMPVARKAVQAVKLHASDLMLSVVSGQGAAEDGLPDLRPLLRLRQLYPHSRKLRRLWCRASQGCTMSPSAVRAMGQHCIAVHALLMVLSLRPLFASRFSSRLTGSRLGWRT